MARVKSKDTSAELKVRSYLHRRGLRFRVNVSSLPGRPDIVFRRYKTAVFVHGCFWHQHSGCKRSVRPATNRDYWDPKLDRNVVRDSNNAEALQSLSWNVLVIWECELKDESNLENLYDSIVDNG